jgi:predicted small lipoprotein YifL
MFRFVLLFMVATSVCGCGASGPYPVPVKGEVTLDNQPLSEGVISFISLGEVPETVVIHNGTFSGKATWGKRRVEIAAYRPYQIPPEIPQSMHALMKDGKENYLPEIYHMKSQLTAEITPTGPNTFKFELSSQ